MDENAAPDLGDALRDAVGPTVENLVEFAMQLWWFWLLVGAVLLARLLLFVIRERRLARSGIRDIDAMDGPTFERYLATMFRRLGYDAEVVGSSRGDYGGDLMIRKNGQRTIVQAKRYRDKKVGIKAIQEAHTARAMYDCSDAMVVTNSVFSQQARKTAAATGVQLWGRDELVKHLLKAQDAEPRSESIEVRRDAASAPVSPTNGTSGARAMCDTCGVEVSEKVQAYCIANAERFGGRIYCYPHQRRSRRSQYG
jgi:restriction system protein